MADVTPRLRVLLVLAQHPHSTGAELAAILQMPEPTVWWHLRALRVEGLVASTPYLARSWHVPAEVGVSEQDGRAYRLVAELR